MVKDQKSTSTDGRSRENEKRLSNHRTLRVPPRAVKLPTPECLQCGSGSLYRSQSASGTQPFRSKPIGEVLNPESKTKNEEICIFYIPNGVDV